MKNIAEVEPKGPQKVLASRSWPIHLITKSDQCAGRKQFQPPSGHLLSMQPPPAMQLPGCFYQAPNVADVEISHRLQTLPTALCTTLSPKSATPLIQSSRAAIWELSNAIQEVRSTCRRMQRERRSPQRLVQRPAGGLWVSPTEDASFASRPLQPAGKSTHNGT